jgi:hypothetical protein
MNNLAVYEDSSLHEFLLVKKVHGDGVKRSYALGTFASIPGDEYYYCGNHQNVIQVRTTESNPKCPFCHNIMTYGRYYSVKY